MPDQFGGIEVDETKDQFGGVLVDEAPPSRLKLDPREKKREDLQYEMQRTRSEVGGDILEKIADYGTGAADLLAQTGQLLDPTGSIARFRRSIGRPEMVPPIPPEAVKEAVRIPSEIIGRGLHLPVTAPAEGVVKDIGDVAADVGSGLVSAIASPEMAAVGIVGAADRAAASRLLQAQMLSSMPQLAQELQDPDPKVRAEAAANISIMAGGTTEIQRHLDQPKGYIAPDYGSQLRMPTGAEPPAGPPPVFPELSTPEQRAAQFSPLPERAIAPKTLVPEPSPPPPPEPVPPVPAKPVEPPADAPAEPVTPAPVEPETATGVDPNKFTESDVPVSDIKLSEDVPNFKRGANPKTGIVPGQELGGKLDQVGFPPIVLWRRLNGDLEVITGRHRLDLARRTGEKTIKSHIFDEAAGFTKEMALRLDAWANIKDGQGTIEDYADYFKNDAQLTKEEAQQRGLLSRVKGLSGWQLGRDASDDLHAAWKMGRVDEKTALTIARAAPSDPAKQQLGLKLALDKKDPDYIRARLERERAKTEAAQQTDMFGNAIFDDSKADAEAERVAAIRRELKANVQAGQNAARNPEAAAKAGIDVKDPVKAKAQIDAWKAELEKWEGAWWLDPELVKKAKGEPPAPPVEPPNPAVPKLRPGEKGTADLLQGSDAPFNLAGESATDAERLAKEKAKAEADKSEAARIEKERQGDLLAPKPPPVIPPADLPGVVGDFKPEPPRELAVGKGSRAVTMGKDIPLETKADFRKVIDDPNSNISEGHRKMLRFIVDKGLLDQFPGLKAEVTDFIRGGAAGEYTAGKGGEGFMRFARWSDSPTPFHELMHHAWRFLSDEDRATVAQLRQEALSKLPPDLREALSKGLASGEYLRRGLPEDAYRLSNDSEFFAHLMAEKARAALAPKARGIVGKVTNLLKTLYGAFKSAVGLTSKEDLLWKRIISGRYPYQTAEGMKFDPQSRELSLGSFFRRMFGGKPKEEAPKPTPSEKPGELPLGDERKGGGGGYGIAQRIREQRAEAGTGPDIPRGQGLDPEFSVNRGRERLAAGADPEAIMAEFERTHKLSTADMEVARAHGEALTKAADAARGTPNEAAARAASDAWEARSKAMQTEWHGIGSAQQGETDLITGSFTAMSRDFEESTGRKFTPKQEKQAEQVTKKVNEGTEAAKQAEKAVADELNKAVGQPPPPADPRIQGLAERLTDYFKREHDRILAEIKGIKGEGRMLAGIDPELLEKIARAGVYHLAQNLLKSEWVKRMVDDFGDKILPHIDAILKRSEAIANGACEQIAGGEAPKVRKAMGRKPADTTADGTRKVIEGHQKGQAWTLDQIKALWDYARANYLDKGITDQDDIRNGMAADLGISVDEIHRAFGQNAKVKRLTDEMWSRKMDERRLKQQAKIWLQNQKTPGFQRALSYVPRAMFSLKVGFHGTVALGTHAPMVAFQPRFWNTYVRNFAKMYRMVGSPSYFGGQMQDLVRRPNFVVARRNGLQNDPFHFEEFHINPMQAGLGAIHPKVAKAFNTLVGTGNRGYAVLKILRQDMFDQMWNRLPERLKTEDVRESVAQALADDINHQTGVTRGRTPKGVNVALFAPRLEASRVMWLAGDPIRATKTLLDWKNASEADRLFAQNQLKEKLWVMGTAYALLAANQGILMATGSKQKINGVPEFMGGAGFDPMESDFLKFKVAGMDFTYGGAMVNMARLPVKLALAIAYRGKLGKIVLEDERVSKVLFDYARSQASPFAGTVADLTLGRDYSERPLPRKLLGTMEGDTDLPARLRKHGVTEPYTWPEWASETFTPIPIEEGVKEVWGRGMGMNEQQQAQNLKALITISVMSATGGRLSDDYTQNEQPSNAPTRIKGLPSPKIKSR
jgi:hypothetical protein